MMQTLHDYEVVRLMSGERQVPKRERFTLTPRDHQAARWQRRVLDMRQARSPRPLHLRQARQPRPLLRRLACSFNAQAC
jgi:hypothetical protein